MRPEPFARAITPPLDLDTDIYDVDITGSGTTAESGLSTCAAQASEVHFESARAPACALAAVMANIWALHTNAANANAMV